MYVINANNINHAFKQGLDLLLRNASETDDSRNGAVIRVPEPVTTVYTYPMRRVLENPVRNANPFFHLMESLWMLAGRNDLAFVKVFNMRMGKYTDDGVTQPAAYGHRWRKHFMTDQLEFVIAELKRTPTTRRAVMTMADPVADIDCVVHGGADVPCNTGVYFIIRTDGHLDMTVMCRSNDAIWGCYGANAVHMSILHEYVAARAGVRIGMYYQVSNDLHAYTDIFNIAKLKKMHDSQTANYTHHALRLSHLDEDMTKFDADLETFFYLFDNGEMVNPEHFVSEYFRQVVAPMEGAWRTYKRGHRNVSLGLAESIGCDAWRAACIDWLERAWQRKDAA